MEIYSNLKAAWHLNEIEALRAGRQIVPRQVYVVLSDLCNQDCGFCSYRSSIGWSSEGFGEDTGKGFSMNPNRMLPAAKVKEIFDDCAELGVKAIQLTGGGEPTVHPQAETLITYALDLGLQVGLITNGTRFLSEGVLRRLTWIRVSVDAGRERTYEATRGSKLWRKVLTNIEAIAQIPGPVFGCGFVVTKENYTEAFKFCALMRQLGVRYVRLAANLTTQGIGYYDGILDDVCEHVAKAKTLASADFQIDDAFERRLFDLRIGRPEQPFCGQQRFSTYIGGDQHVYRCCNTAYTERGRIGDLREQSFRDWLAHEAPMHYDFFDARGCEHCQFHVKNETLGYLVSRAPAHVEFI